MWFLGVKSALFFGAAPLCNEKVLLKLGCAAEKMANFRAKEAILYT